MRTAASSASPLALLGAAFLAAAALAAGPLPVRPALAAEAAPAALGSGTCRVCHTDPKFGAAFSHRGLESSADGCLTCHEGGDAHVAGRGRKGGISVPAKGAAAAERELCLQCHEEETYAAPKHLAPKGKDARCSACHTLHGTETPRRGPAPGAPLPGGKGPAAGTPPAAPEGAKPPAPAKGKSWMRGGVEGGWRFVGGEEGRYEQDVDLDDGPRLFAARAEGGADDKDPRAARAEFRLEGLGDPHASLLARARKPDAWQFTVRGRRDEQPFPGQNGLPAGETLRESLSADGELRVSRGARVGLGAGTRSHEGDLLATTLENGVVLPVRTERDRTSRDAWASVDLHGRAWHAKVRQAWLWEEGEDGRRRDRSNAAGIDTLIYDDDSDLSGPTTSATVGADALDGRLSVEARASRTALDRDVDASEVRRDDLGGPYVRTTRIRGTGTRVLDVQALDASLDLGRRWSLEAGAERRALREDGEILTTTTVVDTSGTAGKTDAGRDRVTQRTLQESLGVRHTTEGGFSLRGGAEWIEDSLDVPDEAESGSVRGRGLFGGFEGPIARGPVRVRAEVRTARGSDVFTPLTPEDRDDVRLGIAYRDEEDYRVGVDWRHSLLAARASDLASKGNELRVWGGFGNQDGITAEAAWTIRQLTLQVDTLAYSGLSLVPGEAVTKVRSHVLDFGLGFPLASRVRVLGGGAWVIDHGNLPVRAFDATLTLRWEISGNLVARIEYRRREYEEMGFDGLDYDAQILEVALEVRF